jgi:tRNA pseudouridine38-40 synthase
VSRTDAGVHARDQVVAFDTQRDINARGWVLGLLQHLPDEISVVRAARVPAGFEPRAIVSRKRYRYTILQSHVRDPFLAGRAWRVHQRLNHSALQSAAETLLGEHDFRAFRGIEDTRVDTVRRIFRIEVSQSREDPRLLFVDIEGDKFLYKMVRIIVGALVDIGRGRLTSDALARALESGLRTDLGITAPPDGLCLESIELHTADAEFWPSH